MHSYFYLMIISTAAIILNGKRMLLAKRKPGGTLGGKWEFPGGKKKPEETPEQALKRELLEELGISIEIKEYIGTVNFQNKNKDYKLLAYLCSHKDGEILNLEHAEVSWFNINEVKTKDLADSDKSILPKIIKYLENKL